MVLTKEDIENYINRFETSIKDPRQQKLKKFEIAKLYKDAKLHDKAKECIEEYLNVNKKDYRAYNLLGEVNQELKRWDEALRCYKRSIELERTQKDILLRIVEMYSKVPLNQPQIAKVWADKAEKVVPHHPSIFKLRWHLLSISEEKDYNEMENLLAKELTASPRDISLHIKLVNMYIEKDDYEEAFDHCSSLIESKLFQHDTAWLHCAANVFEKLCESNNGHYKAHMNFITTLCWLATDALSNCTSAVALSAIQRLDKALNQLVSLDTSSLPEDVHSKLTLLQTEARGQLYFSLAGIMMKMGKEKTLHWNIALKLACGCLSVSSSIKETESCLNHELHENKIWQSMTCKRISQTDHQLLSLQKVHGKKWMKACITDVCSLAGKQDLIDRLYRGESSSLQSFLANDKDFQPVYNVPDVNTLLEYDRDAIRDDPENLAFLVWIGMNWHLHKGALMLEVHELVAELFFGIKMDVENITNCSPFTLSSKDLEVFIEAVIYSAVDNFLMSNKGKKKEFVCLPSALLPQIVTSGQLEWWNSAFKLHTGKTWQFSTSKLKSIVQNGLEALRAIGNHGIDPRILKFVSDKFLAKADEIVDSSSQKWTNVAHLESLKKRGYYYAIESLRIFERSDADTPKKTRPLIPMLSKPLEEEERREKITELRMGMADAAFKEGAHGSALKYLGELFTADAAYKEAQVYRDLASKEDLKNVEGLRSHLSNLRKARERLQTCLSRLDSNQASLQADVQAEIDEIRDAISEQSGIKPAPSRVLDFHYSTLDETANDNSFESLNENADGNIADSKLALENSMLHEQLAVRNHEFSVMAQRIYKLEREMAELRASQSGNGSMLKSRLDTTSVSGTTDESSSSIPAPKDDITSGSGYLTPKLEPEMSWDPFSPAPVFPVFDKGFFSGLADTVERIEEECETEDDVVTLPENEQSRDSSKVMEDLANKSKEKMDSKGKHEASSDDKVSHDDHIHVEPVVELTKRQEQKTGEEDEETMLSERAKLYRLANGQWKERGIGNIKILFNPKMHQGRIVMRRDQVLRVCANHLIARDMKLEKKKGNASTFIWYTAADMSEDTAAPETFAARFKTEEKANSFNDVFKLCQEKIYKAGSSKDVADSKQNEGKSSLPQIERDVSNQVSKEEKEEEKKNVEVKASNVVKEKPKDLQENNQKSLFGLQMNNIATVKPVISNPGEGGFNFTTSEPKQNEQNENPFKIDISQFKFNFNGKSTLESKPGIFDVKNIFSNATGKVNENLLANEATSAGFSNANDQQKKNAGEESRQFQFFPPNQSTPNMQSSEHAAIFESPNIERLLHRETSSTPSAVLPAPQYSEGVTDQAAYYQSNWEAMQDKYYGDEDAYYVTEGSYYDQESYYTGYYSNEDEYNDNEEDFYYPNAHNEFDYYDQETGQRTANGGSDANSDRQSPNNDVLSSEEPVPRVVQVVDEDIFVTYVKKASFAERAKAARLLLPLNFFALSSSAPCSGCSACSQSNSSTKSVAEASAVLKSAIPKDSPTSRHSSSANIEAPGLFGAASKFQSFSDFVNKSNDNFAMFNHGSTEAGFKGAGATLFSSSNDNDDSDSYDPQYKPIIELKKKENQITGEEGYQHLFKHQAKLYRFDFPTKQWKERGRGEMKLSHHPEKRYCRVLMRRDQVHKICANHPITPDIELKPHGLSTTSLIWVANIDYADEEPTMQQFAIKFKNTDVLNEFMKIFEECKQIMKEYLNNKSESNVNDENGLITTNVTATKSITSEKPLETVDGQKSPSMPYQKSQETICLPRSQKDLSDQQSQLESPSATISSTPPLQSLTATGNSDTMKPKLEKHASNRSAAADVEQHDSKPSISSVWSKYKDDASSWECTDCLVKNKSESKECVCCNTAKPGLELKTSNTVNSEPEKASSFGFKFGQTHSSDFTFGSSSAISFPLLSSSGFKFGFSPSAEKEISPSNSEQVATSTPDTSEPDTSKPDTNDSLTTSVWSKFKGGGNTWKCPACLVQNMLESNECVCCNAVKRGLESETSKTVGSEQQSVSPSGFKFGQTHSSDFTFGSSSAISFPLLSSSAFKFGFSPSSEKEISSSKSEKVETSEPDTSKSDTNDSSTTSVWSKFKGGGNTWECPACLVQNKLESNECVCCNAVKPGLESETSKTVGSEQQSVSPSGFKFGQTQPADSTIPANFKFGSSSAIAFPLLSSSAFKFGFSPSSEKEISSSNSEQVTTSKPDTSKSDTSKPDTSKSDTSEPDTSKPDTNDSLTTSVWSKFKGGGNTWECPACLVQNKLESNECVCCNTVKPGLESETTNNVNSKPENDNPFGLRFGLTQPTDSQVSSIFKFGSSAVTFPKSSNAFGKNTPSLDESSAKTDEVTSTSINSWECPTCSINNETDMEKCTGCRTENPTIAKTKSPGFIMKKSPLLGTAESNSSILSNTKNITISKSDDDRQTPKFVFNFTQTSKSNVDKPSGLIKPIFSNLQSSFSSPFSFRQSDATNKLASENATQFTGTGINSDLNKSKDSEETWKPSFSFTTPSAIQEIPQDEKVEPKSPESPSKMNDHSLPFNPIVTLKKKDSHLTGEENENVVFAEKAKLYRFDKSTKQWKERGVGELKILCKTDTKQYRLLMRRDQVHKLCANHNLVNGMSLKPMQNSDRAFIWTTAADYSEEEVKTEMLAVRFRTSDLAKEFERAFINAVNSADKPRDNAAVHEASKKPSDEEAQGIAAKVAGKQNQIDIMLTYELKPPFEDERKADKLLLPRTFFNQLKVNMEGSQQDLTNNDRVDESNVSVVSNQAEVKAPTVSASSPEKYHEDEECKAVFTPLVQLHKVELTTGEESEKVIFCQKAKVYRLDSAIPAWKERGVGQLKILKNQQNGQIRLLMRRDQVKKLCMNHSILPGMKIEVGTMAKRTYVWFTHADYSDETPSAEKFAVRFQTDEAFNDFKKCFDSAIAMRNMDATDEGRPVDVPKVASLAEVTDDIKHESKELDSGNVLAKFGGVFNLGTVESKASIQSDEISSTVSDKKEQVDAEKRLFEFPSKIQSGISFNWPIKEKTDPSTSNTSEKEASTPDTGKMFDSFDIQTKEGAGFFSFNDTKEKQGSPFTNSVFDVQSSNNFFNWSSPSMPIIQTKENEESASTGPVKLSSDRNEDNYHLEEECKADFKAIVTLEKTSRRTGEEMEEEIFCERAKAYRYDSDGPQWKERGVGEVKILKNNNNGQCRILMRRDQVKKICINHVILPEMKLEPNSGSAKSWVWMTHADFSDEEPKVEKFAIRFRNQSLSCRFKESFETAKSLKLAARKFPKATDESGQNYLRITNEAIQNNDTNGDEANNSTENECENETENQNENLNDHNKVTDIVESNDNQAEAMAGNGSGNEAAVKQEAVNYARGSFADSEATVVTAPHNKPHGQREEEQKATLSLLDSKVSEDLSITFVKTPSAEEREKAQKFMLPETFFVPSTSTPCKRGKTNFLPDATEIPNLQQPLSDVPHSEMRQLNFGFNATGVSFADLISSNENNLFVAKSTKSPEGFKNQGQVLFQPKAESGSEEFEDAQINFKPIVSLTQKEVKTGEEDEETLFNERCKLYRLDKSANQWKERGTGNLKILHMKAKNTYRIVVRRDQVHKVCANHFIQSEMKVTPKEGSEKIWLWKTNADISDGNAKEEMFTARFKSADIGKAFAAKVVECSAHLKMIEKCESQQVEQSRESHVNTSQNYVDDDEKSPIKEQENQTQSPLNNDDAANEINTDAAHENDAVNEQKAFGSNFSGLSFASLASGATPTFKASEKSGFQGTGTVLFSSPASPSEQEYDPYYEPIIQLTKVKSDNGEEKETVAFESRIKLYKFNSEAKQWKERGVGNLKLMHNETGRGRLLMRREQVQKVCANHLLVKGMKLEEMKTSNRTLMWKTMADMSDEKPEETLFAARFKSDDILKDFARIFESLCENEGVKTE